MPAQDNWLAWVIIKRLSLYSTAVSHCTTKTGLVNREGLLLVIVGRLEASSGDVDAGIKHCARLNLQRFSAKI